MLTFLSACSLVMKWRFTDRVKKQMDAFLRVRNTVLWCALKICITLSLSLSLSLLQGFSDLIPLPLIKVFDERELEVSALYTYPLSTTPLLYLGVWH